MCCEVANNVIFTQRRSAAKNAGCFQRRLFACVFVCLFVNTINAERVNIGRQNMGIGALYKNLGRVRIWGYSPLGAHPQNVAFGYDVRRLSSCCFSSANLLASTVVTTACFIEIDNLYLFTIN